MKKKKDLVDLGLNEDEVLDFSDFEDLGETDEKEIEKTFIFHITDGCPICGGDVKGNDHYKYLCKNCNILFDKKDILDKEFGGTGIGPVRKTKLNDDESKALFEKRAELKKRVFAAFSDDEKKEMVETHEAPEEEAVDELPEEETVQTRTDSADLDAVSAVLGGGPVEAEFEEADVEESEPEGFEEEVEGVEEADEEPEQEAPEYELEDADKIIASSESNKMHSGQCHFVKKIHPENRLSIDTIAEGEEAGYKMCVCLRRMKAKGKIK